jgi:hypothetical protein
MSQGRGIGEQVVGLGNSWLHRETLEEPRETWANIAFAIDLSCQSFF